MNTPRKILIVTALAAAVVGAVTLKKGKAPAEPNTSEAGPGASAPSESSHAKGVAVSADRLPKLLDLGAGKCIPCKLMAPILEDLKEDYAGRMEVEFIDVWEKQDAGKQYGIEIIPTQIFYDANGKELFRHVGFFGKEDILAKWEELGVDVSGGKASGGIVLEAPVAADTRLREAVCFICDSDVYPKTRTLVKGQTEQRVLCGPHCYFIFFSSVIGADPKSEDAKVTVSDWSTDRAVTATAATYLYSMDTKGRPTMKAFANPEGAEKERQANAGIVIGWDVLRSKELATRCGFCDRAVYPEDACKVIVEGRTRTYGCCTHCAMGVAARTGKDIEVDAYDGFSGEPIHVKTLNGMIASIEPSTAVAWFGQKMNAESKWVSAGCFKQGFFVTQDNLRKWLKARPAMTGREITIARALANKMRLTPEQIAKACKLGECQ